MTTTNRRVKIMKEAGIKSKKLLKAEKELIDECNVRQIRNSLPKKTTDSQDVILGFISLILLSIGVWYSKIAI